MKKILFSILSTCSLYATTSYYYDPSSLGLTTDASGTKYKLYDQSGVQYGFTGAEVSNIPSLTTSGNVYLKAFKTDLFIIDYFTSPSNYAKLLHFVHSPNDTDGFVHDKDFKILSPGLTSQWADNNLTSYAVNIGKTEVDWQADADNIQVKNTYLKTENGKKVLALSSTDGGEISKLEYTEGTKIPTIKTLAASSTFVDEFLLPSVTKAVIYADNLSSAFANEGTTNWVIFGKGGIAGSSLSFDTADEVGGQITDPAAALNAATKFAVITSATNDQIIDKLLPILRTNLNPSDSGKTVPTAFLNNFKVSAGGDLALANPLTFPINHYLTTVIDNTDATSKNTTSNTALTDAENGPDFSTYTVPYSKGGFPGTTIPIELANLNKFYIYATAGMGTDTVEFPFKIAKNYDGKEVVKSGNLKVTFA